MTLELGLAPVATLAAAVGVAALIGCGGSDGTATEKETPAATRAQSAVVPDQLVGIWTHTVAGRTRRGRSCGQRASKATYRMQLCASESKWVPPGIVSLTVRRDGNVEVNEGGTDPARDCLTEDFCWTMVISARDGKLVIGETPRCTDPATYSYEVTLDRLTTQLVNDRCGDQRPFLFDGTTWRRQS